MHMGEEIHLEILIPVFSGLHPEAVLLDHVEVLI